MMDELAWTVYILRCADGSLYTGITRDVARRVEEHNSSGPLAAHYTRARRPVAVVYQETAATRSAACKREYWIKQMSRSGKETLVAGTSGASPNLTGVHPIGGATMKKPKRSAKAPAAGRGNLPGASNKPGSGSPAASGAARRHEVRQLTRRVNVPRSSQRPVERSKQRRSRRP